MTGLDDGGVAVLTAAGEVLKFSAGGQLEWSQAGPTRVEALTSLPGGPALAAPAAATQALTVTLLDHAGAVVTAHEYPGIRDLVHAQVARSTDGRLLLAGLSEVGGAYAIKADAWGGVVGCSRPVPADLSDVLFSESVLVPPRAVALAAASTPEGRAATLEPHSTLPVCHAGCRGTPATVAGLTLTKYRAPGGPPPRGGSTGRCVVTGWVPDPSFVEVNLWAVAAKEDIDLARQPGAPPAQPVPDYGACRSLPAGDLVYVQARAACDSVSEGP